ncbi:MAG: hypothetical protein FH758_05030 [Firmicutes bacterium]|nr:hypothetical protein [Bacillota bacterium]
MSESLRFNVLKEMIEKNKIQLSLDRRKSIDYYNQKVYKGQIEVPKILLRMRTLSTVAGYSLVIGLYCLFFIDPYLYGLLITFTAVYTRYIVWKHLKNIAINYTREDILKNEDNLQNLYKDSAFTLRNKETGKITRHPEKWTTVLPKKQEVLKKEE